MAYQVYTVTLPEHPEAVMFIQGIVARNLAGLFWMWRNLLWLKKSNATAEGCVQVKAGICGINEVVLASYWEDKSGLGKFFKSQPHQKMMQYLSDHPNNLALYNETYRPSRSGKYVNEPNGLAVIYPRSG
jgi:fumigallin biosynthesis monooxygenase-like protein